MKQWIYPGSFDPVTLGHVDIIQRAAAQCDRLTVAVLINVAKQGAFSLEERVELLRLATAHIPNVSVDSFSGLTVDYVRRCGAAAVVRGLRSAADFAAEQTLDDCNRRLMPTMETVYFMARPELGCVSSSAVREIARFGGPLEAFVPEAIVERVAQRLRR